MRLFRLRCPRVMLSVCSGNWAVSRVTSLTSAGRLFWGVCAAKVHCLLEVRPVCGTADKRHMPTTMLFPYTGAVTVS